MRQFQYQTRRICLKLSQDELEEGESELDGLGDDNDEDDNELLDEDGDCDEDELLDEDPQQR